MPVDAGSWAGLVTAAFVGAATALIAGIPLEHYKRHRDRQGAAAVFAAEIGAQMRVTEQNKTVEAFKAFQAKLDSGIDVSLPSGLYTAPPEYGPIFDKHIDKLGLLPPEVSARVVEFYVYLVGARSTIRNLVNGNFDGRSDARLIKAAQIQAGLSAWESATNIAAILLPRLQEIAADAWPMPTLRAWVPLFRSPPRPPAAG